VSVGVCVGIFMFVYDLDDNAKFRYSAFMLMES